MLNARAAALYLDADDAFDQMEENTHWKDLGFVLCLLSVYIF